jgi:hypothetical protein
MNGFLDNPFCVELRDILLAQLWRKDQASKGMCFSMLTLLSCVRRSIQLGEHGLEGFDSFIIALCCMKHCILRLVSNIRPRALLDYLHITRMSIHHAAADVITPFAHQEVHLPITFVPISPYCG